jgi:hypothetical protein
MKTLADGFERVFIGPNNAVVLVHSAIKRKVCLITPKDMEHEWQIMK